MKFQVRWLLDLEPNDVIKLEVVHLLFFKSTCITVSTWQPRKDVHFRNPFLCEVDELEELEDPIDRLNERELEWDDVPPLSGICRK